ncbi:hypothetical protein M569_02350, partial [Genlisea aurea]
ADSDYTRCEYIVKNWASSSINSEVHNNKLVLRDLLFFLHIPRTGGRTYFYCFLGKLYSTSQQCPRSYDKLRFNPREKNCRLISTHDDYSVMSKFPRDRVSVVTILRNPIDRVFSTYEFSVEVAARFLIHPNLTSLAKGDKMLRLARKKSSTVSTLDIWPWKYLVPWMREDLFARRDARRLRGISDFSPYNSYEMKDIVMPLHDFISDPNVRDIVHNGATFQITGLTNNSYSAESHEVRRCVLRHPSLGKHVLEVAKKRLDEMLYVGLTENHKESATMFANVVGAQVISLHVESNHTTTDLDDSHDNDTSSGIRPEPYIHTYIHTYIRNYVSLFLSAEQNTGENEKPFPKNRNNTREKMTVPRLMEAYERCTVPLRKTHSQRRAKSLKLITPVNFTREERELVSEATLLEIASLNSLDMELYTYAHRIF